MVKKLLLSGALVLSIFLGGQWAFAADTGSPTISLNALPIETSALVEEGSLYLPVRAISESLGYVVDWSSADQTVTLTKNDKRISLQLQNYKVIFNDHDFYMSYAPVILNNRTYMPADFYSDTLGLLVQWNKETNAVVLKSVSENAITINTVKTTSETKALKTELQYPVIEGLENVAVQNSINAIFKQLADNSAKQGVQNAADLAPYLLQYPDMPGQCDTYFNYQVKFNQNNMLSLIFRDYQYAGGAHGNTIQMSYTFNLETGEQVEFADLFKQNADVTTVFNNAVKTQLDERGLTEALFAPFTKINDDPAYYLSNNGVVLYYQQYEILPYVAGIQEFTVDYSLLNDVLKNPELTASDVGIALPAVKAGDTFNITLKGNPTTGYTWHVKIKNSAVITQVSEKSVADSALIGAGSTFTWEFKALETGNTKITFQYYRDWEGEASVTAENTVVYNISVN